MRGAKGKYRYAKRAWFVHLWHLRAPYSRLMYKRLMYIVQGTAALRDVLTAQSRNGSTEAMVITMSTNNTESSESSRPGCPNIIVGWRDVADAEVHNVVHS
jgi:hypothetical protein